MDVATTDTFPATGKRVEETAATGTVRFRNVDFTSANTIPAGSIVSAPGGIRFRTNKSVTVGAASLVGLQIVPKSASVGVTAVKPGPDGNLEPNTILTIPRGESPLTLSVNNPEATTGGTREEFPKITQKDVDAALAALEVALQAEFEEQLADPALAPPGSTVFPETASLGEATPSVDPATLVGTEAASFELGLSATGTVVAVNDEPVAAIAETRLLESVASGSELVEGSIEVTVGPAVVIGGEVTFPVTASATQVAVLDPAELEAMVLGKTPDEAAAILAPYGTATILLSPDWVSTIPTFANRVDLTVDTDPTEGPADQPRSMTGLLGVDLGERRIGIALAEDELSPARPLTTLRRARTATEDAVSLGALMEAHAIVELVIGLPFEAAGQEGSQAALTRTWVEAIRTHIWPFELPSGTNG